MFLLSLEKGWLLRTGFSLAHPVVPPFVFSPFRGRGEEEENSRGRVDSLEHEKEKKNAPTRDQTAYCFVALFYAQ